LKYTKQEKNDEKNILIANINDLQMKLEKVNLECRALKLERKQEVDELREEMIKIS